MFNFNVPAKFQTEMKSMYEVDEYGLIRDKVADPTRKTEHVAKNIYYLIEKSSGHEILAARAEARSGGEPWEYSHIIDIMEDTHQLFMVNTDTKKQLVFDLYRSPKVGMQPFDIFCEPNGTISAKHLAHVGHKITTIFSSKGA